MVHIINCLKIILVAIASKCRQRELLTGELTKCSLILNKTSIIGLQREVEVVRVSSVPNCCNKSNQTIPNGVCALFPSTLSYYLQSLRLGVLICVKFSRARSGNNVNRGMLIAASSEIEVARVSFNYDLRFEYKIRFNCKSFILVL